MSDDCYKCVITSEHLYMDCNFQCHLEVEVEAVVQLCGYYLLCE